MAASARHTGAKASRGVRMKDSGVPGGTSRASPLRRRRAGGRNGVQRSSGRARPTSSRLTRSGHGIGSPPHPRPGTRSFDETMKRRPASPGATLVLDGPRWLDRLRDPTTRLAARHIRLEGPLDDPLLERRLNAVYVACGCQAGSVAVLITTLVCVLGGLTGGFDGRLGWWWVALYVASAAAAGKLAGLAIARLQLRSILRTLSQRADARHAEAFEAARP